jgi:uncharacterized protein YicC (UPF0701 family)
MLRKLYYTTALALIPSAEALTKKLETLAYRFDNLTIHLEGYLEEQAVALAKNSYSRRTALQRLDAAFQRIVDTVSSTVDKLDTAIEAAFNRREDRILSKLDDLHTHLEKASRARDAVAQIIGR